MCCAGRVNMSDTVTTRNRHTTTSFLGGQTSSEMLEAPRQQGCSWGVVVFAFCVYHHLLLGEPFFLDHASVYNIFERVPIRPQVLLTITVGHEPDALGQSKRSEHCPVTWYS